MPKPRTQPPATPSLLIDQRLGELDDWRGKTLARLRQLILKADPNIVEEWKWQNPVWSCDGILCTGESYKNAVKLTFPKGASLDDPDQLFNASLEGNARRAIDLHEGDTLNAKAFQKLIRAAVAYNQSFKNPVPGAPVKLLSGGNPQIPKGYGEAPVAAYLDALPGWKQRVGRQLDALIVKAVPGVTKAVKWNTPFYGLDGQTWFVGYHCMTRYIKVSFFRGTSLKPIPPGTSKQKEVRYLDVYENEPLDEAQFTSWIQQASKLPGEKL